MNAQAVSQDRSQRRLSSAGFTLIELLIVVALIGLITLVALPGMSNIFKISLGSTSREMAAIVKEAYNSAVMTGKVHRLVYDMTEHKYWVEVGPASMLLDTTETKERDARRKRFTRSSDEAKEEAPVFQLAKSVTRRKLSLPRGVEFEDVITEQSPEPITSGAAYTHFLPHGLTEQTIIHLKDTSNHHVSIVLSPLIGKSQVVDRYLSKQEAYGK